MGLIIFLFKSKYSKKNKIKVSLIVIISFFVFAWLHDLINSSLSNRMFEENIWSNYERDLHHLIKVIFNLSSIIIPGIKILLFGLIIFLFKSKDSKENKK